MDNDIRNEESQGRNATGSHERIERAAARFKQGTSNAVEGAKEKIDRAADRVESGLHRATDAGARGAERAADKAAEWRYRGTELASDARERMDTAFDSMRDFVREKPVQSVAIALLAGWVIGKLMRPRH